MQYSFPSSDYSLIINCRDDYNCEQPKMDNIGKKIKLDESITDFKFTYSRYKFKDN